MVLGLLRFAEGGRADPDYQEVIRWRTLALEEAVLQPTIPWAGN